MYYIVSELEYTEPAVRLVDTADNSVQDMSIAELISYMENDSMVIENAVVENGKLRMVNGELTRYGKVKIGETTDDDVVISEAIVVLEELVNEEGTIIGYTVATANGEIGDYSLEDMLLFAKKHRFANGEFENKAGNMFMTAPEKPYPQVTIDADGDGNPDEEVESKLQNQEEEAKEEVFVKLVVMKDGKERNSKVRVNELAKALEVIGYNGVISAEGENGTIILTRGVPDELIKETNDTLVEIEIPEGVELGQNVFANSKRLRRVSIASENIGAGAFMMCTALKRVEMPNVVKIGDLAFFGTSKLNDIIFPNTLESIGGNAFDGSGLDIVELPSSVTSVGSLAFSRCENLVRVSMPTDIMKSWAANLKIYSAAVKNKSLSFDTCDDMGIFYGCTALEKINLKPEDIIRIGDYQFKGCEKLYEVAKSRT